MSKKPNLLLDMEVFGGANIMDAAQDAVSIARGLSVGVRFSFNKVSVVVLPGDDATDVGDRWAKEYYKRPGAVT